MKTICIAVSLVCVLGGCAGSGITEPKGPVDIPTLPSANNNQSFKPNETLPARMQTLSTADTPSGQLEAVDVPARFTGTPEPELMYRTKDGTLYRFSEFTNPIVPSSFSPSWKMETRHQGQNTEKHGKMMVCCSGGGVFRYAAATDLKHVRFGAWGNGELFVGGVVSDPALMPGGSHEKVRDIKGKATYEVWALRVKDGQFVSSSYTPKSYSTSKGEPVVSLFTANFNTGKMGGTIVGNSDFGADVELKNVDIHGNAFSGTAQSAGKIGQVDGRFFGEPRTYGYGKYVEITGPATAEIGGKIVFDGNRSLDTVFGGKRVNEQYKDDSSDLNPLQ